MKRKSVAGNKRSQPFRILLGLGLGMASIGVAMPAHASVPTQGCSDSAPPSTIATFSHVQVSRELAFLRQIDLHETLGFAGNKLLADSTCSGSCGADGSAHYSQSAGCTYTQTCGGNPKQLQG